MIFLAALAFADRQWLWPVLAAFLCATALIAWVYARSGMARRFALACAALKIAGVGLLLACLLEPLWTGQRVKPGANLLAVVADNSQSMTLHDRDRPEARGDALRRVLGGEGAEWRTRLAKDFEVRNFLADARLQPSQDFREFTFAGTSSSLGTSLRQLSERFRGEPLAGVVLLTDGVAGDLDDLSTLAGLPPIYPVLIGGEQAAGDLAVASTAVSQTSFEDAPVTVQAEIVASGFGGQEITGTLTPLESKVGEDAPKPIAEQTVTIPADSEKVVLRFQFRPEKNGVLFYRLHIAPKLADAPAEATLANNDAILTIDRGAGPHRVLYVSGRPNWEYKFLHRAVQGDDQTHLVGLIRIARREPKFEFRGRAGESSNPLFRGFGNQSAEEIERYDQPVLTRLDVEPEDEASLRGGFPKTADALFRYKAVIIDDLEAAFFTAEQMTLLQRFVSERGGGLLMLGGAESFADGKFQRTPIGEMLPIYLKSPEAGSGGGQAAFGAGREWRLDLSREGWLQPWVRLRASEGAERERLADLPHFDLMNSAGEPKPAASVLATVTDGSTQVPALVTQRFGRGRTAALLIGDFWQAGLGDEKLSKDLRKAWRQMVRWLVADVPEPVEVRAEPASDGHSVRLQARVRDRNFQPVDDAGVVLKVQPIGSAAGEITLSAEPSASEPGVYEATFLSRENGGFRVSVSASDANGAPLGEAQAGWSSNLASSEFRSLVPNRALMETLARQTGGRVLAPEQLAAFAKELPNLRAPITETWTRPLWNQPATLLLALACLVSEWGLRRWKGLA